MSEKLKSDFEYVDELFNETREGNLDPINPFSYWVLEGKIAAGEYPGRQFSVNPSTFIASVVHSVIALLRSKFVARNSPGWKIGCLMDAGVDTFIDLTESGERPSYNRHLHSQRRKRSRRSKYYRFPITDKNVTSRQQMKEILDLIDSEVFEGRSVYIHCFRGLGRTGIVVGCLLSRHGLSGAEALKRIPELRKGLAGDFRESPENDSQRQFILNWSE